MRIMHEGMRSEEQGEERVVVENATWEGDASTKTSHTKTSRLMEFLSIARERKKKAMRRRGKKREREEEEECGISSSSPYACAHMQESKGERCRA